MTELAYGRLRAVTPFASVVLEQNPGPMTLDGTNTWLLRAPGSAACVVVDPGDEDVPHLERVAEAAGTVALVLITHWHHDHVGGAPWFADQTGAPVRALDPALTVGGAPLVDGEVIETAGVRLQVVATPGHTADSVSFLLDGPDADPAVLTGDTILGRGTTVIAHPDGALGPYLTSLRRLAELSPGTVVLPGHGPELPDAAAIASGYLAHREQRLDQVRAALATLGADASPAQVVEHVYADVDRSLWRAAELSVRAQLDYLRSA
ncbi:MBL fold metallo-hydrolase [Pseudonocardia sp. CA-107938]|uniref:MBL fold metallo-hydrolase n=1 Tax=Pseudonocardia sp. CA-107938 TaxID=3240021 RepID=UPI003D94C9F6